MAKGFKNKYFSLTAIAATVSAVTLAAQAASVEHIDKVVVSAAKAEEPIKSTTEDIEIWSAEDLQEEGIETLSELMHYVLGSEVSSNGGAGKSTSLYLRGLPNDKILILIDGVRYNDPSNFNGPQIEHLSLLGIERVEIVKGAQSGIWGSDAAAGVINIITNRQKHKSVRLEIGSFNTSTLKTSIADRVGAFDYGLDFGFLHTRGFSAITPFGQNPRDFEPDGYTNRSARARVGLSIPNGHLQISGIYIDAYNEGDGYNPTTYAPDPDSKNDDKYRYTAPFFNANYRIAGQELSIHADTTKTKREFLDTAWGVNYFEGRTKNLELKDRYDYSKGVAQAGVGYQRFESLFSDTSGKSGDLEYHNPYGFVTNKNRFGSLLVSENIRYDDYSDFDDQWTGKVGLRYDFGQISVRANYSSAYNVPNQIKMINPWGRPNHDLQPEKTRSYDIGISGFGFKTVLFEERVKDLIDWYDPDPDTFGDEYYINRPGTSKFKGVELGYERDLLENLWIALGYTYLSPKNSKKEVLLRRARRKFTYSLSWYPSSEHVINISGYYVGSRFDIGGKQTGKYNITNLSASHRFAKNFTGFVRVKNLFDRRYQEVYGYAGWPRAINVGIEGSF